MSAPDPSALSGRRLEDQTAIVSGASSGLGRAIARRLAAEGAAVVCGDLQRPPRPGRRDGEEPTDEVITASGAQASFVKWDVRVPAETTAAFEHAIERYGRLDIIVANAGVSLPEGGALPDESEETWTQHLETNLTGVWNTNRFGLKALIEQGRGGRIVNIASTGGMFAVDGVPAGYGATKAGVIQLTRQSALAGGAHKITANAVCPGMTRAGLSTVLLDKPELVERISAAHPLGRMGDGSDIAAAVAFFASPDAAWITGVFLPVDGGRTCVSSFGDLGLN
jgi:NAD(P)-dependent dehydrogenase (short-subunit alcohol dehydrogenase family)